MTITPHYVVLNDLLLHAAANALAELAAREQRWKLHEAPFFSQYDLAWVCRTFDRTTGEPTREMTLLRDIGIRSIESRMNAVIGRHHTITGHKMVEGQWVGIHNDSPVRDRGRIENFRLVYYFDPAFHDEKGGRLLLFGSDNEADVIATVPPDFNSAILIELSDRSFHAVSPVRQGERYCMIVSYWGYPVPFFSQPAERDRAARCIRRVIEAGLEEIDYDGTTLAYHLYNTFRLLVTWNARMEVCLAGLMHSAFRGNPAHAQVGISRDEMRDLVGEWALAVIETLPLLSSSRQIPVASAIQQGALLVELAQTLELASNADHIAAAKDLLGQLALTAPAVCSAAGAELARREARVKARQQAPTVTS